MTQNGGIDVLIACFSFGVLLVLLGWFVLRHRGDPIDRALDSDDDPSGEGWPVVDGPEDDTDDD